MNKIEQIKSYPYRFVQKINPTPSDCFLHKLLYDFKSGKSKYRYWVILECYEHNIYAIKFHLKSDKNNKLKYNRLTNLGEFRPIINTCVNIVLDVYKKEASASFGFIGSNTMTDKFSEIKSDTKRYHIYKRLMVTYFSDERFKHIADKQKSSYMLLRKSEIEKNPTLESDIIKLFAFLYSELS